MRATPCNGNHGERGFRQDCQSNCQHLNEVAFWLFFLKTNCCCSVSFTLNFFEFPALCFCTCTRARTVWRIYQGKSANHLADEPVRNWMTIYHISILQLTMKHPEHFMYQQGWPCSWCLMFVEVQWPHLRTSVSCLCQKGCDIHLDFIVLCSKQ